MDKKLGKLITLIFVLLSLNTNAYDNNRPKIGLVLSGGGARGLAHIGVLRELEKKKIML